VTAPNHRATDLIEPPPVRLGVDHPLGPQQLQQGPRLLGSVTRQLGIRPFAHLHAPHVRSSILCYLLICSYVTTAQSVGPATSAAPRAAFGRIAR